MLTDIKIRQAKPAEKPVKLTDSHGLYLEVRPSGSRLWRYRYKIAGKENIFAIGGYPGVTLAAAREARDAAKQLVKEGKHPSHSRQARIAETIHAGKNTFQAVAEEWIANKSLRWSKSHAATVASILKADAYPEIGRSPIKSISAHQILSMMRKVESRGAPSVAVILRGYCSQIFRYAVVTQRADSDPSAILTGVIHTAPTEHSRALSEEEVATIYAGLSHYPNRRTELAIRLVMLTFLRTSEVIAARKTEIDLERGEWQIPAERMKARRIHVTPLSTQCIALLREMMEMSGGNEFLLPSMWSNPISPTMGRGTINSALTRLLPDSPYPVTGHDFRATASTHLKWAGAMSWWKCSSRTRIRIKCGRHITTRNISRIGAP